MDEAHPGTRLRFTDEVLRHTLRGKSISDEGSTVIVIEHNRDVISRADWVIDLGPGAGHEGGKVVFEGPPAALLKAKGSLTGEFLAKWQEA